MKDKTDEQLIEENVKLKKSIVEIQAKKKVIADELRRRDLYRRLGTSLDGMSEREKETLQDLLNLKGSGNVVVTPAPAVLVARSPEPISVPKKSFLKRLFGR